MWQTSGAPHQLVIAPATRQPASGLAKKKSEVPGRQKASPLPQAPGLLRPSGGRGKKKSGMLGRFICVWLLFC